MPNGQPLLQRFEQKYIQKTADECWPWIAATDGKGYGRIYVFHNKNGHPTSKPAPRISYSLYVGKVPSRMDVCHHCDNPPCVNPNHLFLGTRRDNVIDMVDKGRCRAGWQNSERTHCKYGHKFSGSNLRIDSTGHRQCGKCLSKRSGSWQKNNRDKVNERDRRRYAKTKVEAS